MKESRVCGFNIILDTNGNLVTEEATVKESDIDKLELKEKDKEIIKSVLRVFKRQAVGMHYAIEKELELGQHSH